MAAARPLSQLLFVAVALAVSIAACGSADDGVAVPPIPTPAPTPTTVDTTSSAKNEPVEPGAAVYRVVATSCGAGVEAVATGVAIDERRVVTVAHTLERAASVELRAADGSRRDATVVLVDPLVDLAVLRLSDATDTWLPLGDEDAIAVGDEVRVISATTDTVSTQSAIVRRIVAITLDGAGRRQGLELDAEITSGDSGSPVIDRAGTVAGIVFAANRNAQTGWAIASSEIRAVLAQQEDGPIDLAC